MDLFNKKKLSEKEAEIGALLENGQRLEKKLSQLEAHIIELKEEKQRENILHKDVVDTMLGEIQAFISANHDKNLSYLSFKTLFPLVKEILEDHSFLLKIEINHFLYQIYPPATHKDLIVAHGEHIIDKLTGLQMIETSNFDSFEERDSNASNRPVLKYQINTRYSIDDFRKKLILLNTDIFKVNSKPAIKFKDISVTQDEDCITLSLRNVQSRTRGFP